jgi:hypothetical protein
VRSCQSTASAARSGEPLHDVEAAEVSFELEVPALREVVRVRWVKLARATVARIRLLRVHTPQRRREPLEVWPVGREADIDGLRRPDHAVKRDREAADDDVTDSGLRQAPQKRVSAGHFPGAAPGFGELGSELAQADPLIEALGHRQLRVLVYPCDPDLLIAAGEGFDVAWFLHDVNSTCRSGLDHPPRRAVPPRACS